MCSVQDEVPRTDTGMNTIWYGESGSDIEKEMSDAEIISSPSSSRSSRLAAASSVSSGSTLPPGNSHRPPCRLESGRWQTRNSLSRDITQAITRTGIYRNMESMVPTARISRWPGSSHIPSHGADTTIVSDGPDNRWQRRTDVRGRSDDEMSGKAKRIHRRRLFPISR
jgi:hypothetical protein